MKTYNPVPAPDRRDDHKDPGRLHAAIVRTAVSRSLTDAIQ